MIISEIVLHTFLSMILVSIPTHVGIIYRSFYTSFTPIVESDSANATLTLIGSLPVTPEITKLEAAYKSFIFVRKNRNQSKISNLYLE